MNNKKWAIEQMLKGEIIYNPHIVNEYYFYEDRFFYKKDLEGKHYFDINDLLHSDFWSIYQPPKQKKKITLYRYTYETISNNIFQNYWTSEKWEDFKSGSHSALLKTETKEIEIECDE